ncbi:uncharacterized protein LOC124166480 [Ischnura elegans]|uniref:uncharacterized protein LOC124166480 n=1 Tax=Ischnura elegans TaxID=197161 RepID=UPI001ED887FB|nr:uncharacterized protein LOC124166480 [Ischnura elegans]
MMEKGLEAKLPGYWTYRRCLADLSRICFHPPLGFLSTCLFACCFTSACSASVICLVLCCSSSTWTRVRSTRTSISASPMASTRTRGRSSSTPPSASSACSFSPSSSSCPLTSPQSSPSHGARRCSRRRLVRRSSSSWGVRGAGVGGRWG